MMRHVTAGRLSIIDLGQQAEGMGQHAHEGPMAAAMQQHIFADDME